MTKVLKRFKRRVFGDDGRCNAVVYFKSGASATTKLDKNHTLSTGSFKDTNIWSFCSRDGKTTVFTLGDRIDFIEVENH